MLIGKKLPILLIILLLLGTGCSSDAERPEYTYQVTVSTSQVSTQTYDVIADVPELSVLDFLQRLDPNIVLNTREGNTVILTFQNVVSTMAKEWKLSINNTPVTYSDLTLVPVEASDTIVLSYENTK